MKNNKKYVGQSIDVNCRLRKHFTKLRNGKHENRHLQRSFNKYGEETFKSYILEECSQEELNDREKYWIEKIKAYEKGFNLTIGGDGINGWKADDEFKKHMSEIVSGEKNPNYGHKWTDEMKRNLSEQRKGLYANKNNPNSKRVICVEKLKVYETINDASVDCQCKSPSSISRCLKDKGYVANNYHFVLYDEEMYQYLLENQFEYLCECYKGKGIIADLTNKSFYKKYELKEKLYRSLNNTTREIMKMINQSKFEIENVQYVLL